MQRQYLYVPYEEKTEAKARGAHWDTESRRWYLTPEQDRSLFTRWLSPDGASEADEGRYLIESEQAFVASTKSHCQYCAAEIDVIAIYCVRGTLEGEPLDDFSVMHITAVDNALRTQLERWPFFREHKSVYRNFCSHCQSPQEDMDLHCEPDGAFFHMDVKSRKAMTMTPLLGCVQLSGAETFEA